MRREYMGNENELYNLHGKGERGKRDLQERVRGINKLKTWLGRNLAVFLFQTRSMRL